MTDNWGNRSDERQISHHRELKWGIMVKRRKVMYNKEAHEKALERAYKFVADNIGPDVPDDRFFLVT
jgi:hypothetical protein